MNKISTNSDGNEERRAQMWSCHQAEEATVCGKLLALRRPLALSPSVIRNLRKAFLHAPPPGFPRLSSWSQSPRVRLIQTSLERFESILCFYIFSFFPRIKRRYTHTHAHMYTQPNTYAWPYPILCGPSWLNLPTSSTNCAQLWTHTPPRSFSLPCLTHSHP